MPMPSTAVQPGSPAASAANESLPSLPGEPGKAAPDLLEAEHVGVAHLPADAEDALRIDDAVGAAAPLDVPGDELHRLPPAGR